MNSSCWRETLKSDSWKMGTFVWRRSVNTRAMRRKKQLTLVWTVNFTFSFSLSASDISIWISWLFGSSESVLECYKDGIVSLWCSKCRQSTFPFGDSTVASGDWTEMTSQQNRPSWISKNSRASFTIRRSPEEIRRVDLSEKDSVHLQCRRYS